jgi:HEAT repeat protein
MPLIKRNAVQPAAAAGGDRPQLLAALASPDADLRWNAARALGADAGDVPALAAALDAEAVPRVREAIMTALMRIGNAASVKVLLPYLRSPDASRRSAAIEALQSLPDAIAPFMTALLGDEDSDVRILAVELVRGMPAAEATRLLCRLLEAEQHPNACASAVDALAEIGTQEALPTLRRCAERFAATAFLPFAIAVAITRISESEGQGANGTI